MQTSHRIWLEHHGAGPWPCHRCTEPVTDLGGQIRTGRAIELGIIHHDDLNHQNNDPGNLRLMHDRCHVAHHKELVMRPALALPAVDPDSPLPSYRQLAAHLRQRIAAGEITGRLPSYTELVTETGMSLGVVQRAIKVLVDEGLVVTSQGHGVFVKREQ